MKLCSARRVLPVLGTCMLLIAGGSAGLRPRASAADYPAHTEAGIASVGAAVIADNDVKKIVAADLGKAGYIAIEVGVFPAGGHEVNLSPADFTLMAESGGAALRPVESETVAAVIEKKQMPSPQTTSPGGIGTVAGVEVGHSTYPDPITGRRTGATTTGVGVGTGNGPMAEPCRTAACDDRYPSPAPPPAQTPSIADRHQVEQTLWEKSLPDGFTKQPVAGYLYFPKPSGKDKNGPWQLRWDNANSRVTLDLKSATKR